MDPVEVVYALPDRQRIVSVAYVDGMTAAAAVDASGLLREFPELGATRLTLGIYGESVEASRRVRPGDRVEIYRPLRIDPREARRLRAAHERRG
jgi:putative ubiquitin-RnfH superfamily antitoxin RatB of RatAB toxin-antitoxin module